MEMQAKNHLSFLRNSLYEKYSDFTIICEDEWIPVHKLVVCSQSPVFAAAVDSPLIGAQTNTCKIDRFDKRTVKLMLDFLYTGRYHIEEVFGISGERGEPGGMEAIDSVFYHIKVHRIGTHFQIPGLRLQALQELNHIWGGDWNVRKPRAFEMFDEALENAFEKDLKHLFVRTVKTTVHMTRRVFGPTLPESEIINNSLRLHECSVTDSDTDSEKDSEIPYSALKDLDHIPMHPALAALGLCFFKTVQLVYWMDKLGREEWKERLGELLGELDGARMEIEGLAEANCEDAEGAMDEV